MWTLHLLNSLRESNSGCFLEGPQGESTRLSGSVDGCSCASVDSLGGPNPFRQSCCAACKSGGDTSLICPSDSPSDTWTVPYVCPSDAAEAEAEAKAKAKAKAMRRSRLSTVSRRAAAAQAVAEAQAASQTVSSSLASSLALSLSSSSSSSELCGCSADAGEWKLVSRQLSLFDAIRDLVADVGKIIVDGADDLLDIVEAPLGKLGDLVSQLLLGVGVAVAVAVAVVSTVLIIRAVLKKKKKKKNRVPTFR